MLGVVGVLRSRASTKSCKYPEGTRGRSHWKLGEGSWGGDEGDARML